MRSRIIWLFICSSFILVLVGCGGRAKKINERVTMWRKDKLPYGLYYAYEQLPYIFPNAEILIDKESPERKFNLFQTKSNPIHQKLYDHKGQIAHVIVTPQIYPSIEELGALLNFVYDGNQLFLSSFEFGNTLLDTLKLKINGGVQYDDSLNVKISDPLSLTKHEYNYPGKSYDDYFSSIDTGYTTVLGWNKENRPNFVKIGYDNGGAIYIHLAPVTFTNFFLLHKENKSYYDFALSNIPNDTELVLWGEYFRAHRDGEDGNSNSHAFTWMMQQPPLAWALWLLLALFAFIYLFESKRRQKQIAVRKPLKNTSLEFVKTIGRLYYQRRDNKNLVGKMVAHFFGHVRSKYNLSTSKMDDEFEKRLAFKTGIELQTIRDIVYQSRYLSDQPSVSDMELLLFNEQLQTFYQKA
ncbi:MAG: hypothetical protein H7Y31_01655 [Chitinophagaceae bacterium]|nr:hypothetical protein [Chitinophagaceae bacterium]